jgi:hypothetical protein
MSTHRLPSDFARDDSVRREVVLRSAPDAEADGRPERGPDRATLPGWADHLTPPIVWSMSRG